MIKKGKGYVLILIVPILILLSVAIYLGVDSFRNHSVEYQLRQAAISIQKDDLKSAVSRYEKAIELDGENSGLRLELAEIYLKNNQSVKYLNQLNEVVHAPYSSEEDVEQAYNKLITYYDGQGDYTTINQLLKICNNANVLNANQRYLAKAPEFSHEEGTYEEVIPLKLTSNATGTIYYTIDGSVPNENSSVYSSPIYLEHGDYTVATFFVNEFGIRSNIAKKTYHIDIPVPETPKILTEASTYTRPQMIAVEMPEDCKVYYTIDGTIPNDGSMQYTAPVPMPLGKSEFRFVAYNEQGAAGNVSNCMYELVLDTEFTPEACCRKVARNVEEYSKNTDSQVEYKYVFRYAIALEDSDYYVVEEVYQDKAGVQSGTGCYYAADIYTKEIYKLSFDENGDYSLIQI